MKKKQTKPRVLALMVMVALLLGLFPASALDASATDKSTAENFGMEGLYVDAPEVLDPRLQNYTNVLWSGNQLFSDADFALVNTPQNRSLTYNGYINIQETGLSGTNLSDMTPVFAHEL